MPVGKPKGLPGYSGDRAKRVKEGFEKKDFLQKLLLNLFGSDEEEEPTLDKCEKCPDCEGCETYERLKKEAEETPTATPTATPTPSDKVSEGLKKLIEMKRKGK